MRLKNRLERLESILKINENLADGVKQTKELLKSWMANDPKAIPLFKAYEDYCIKSGRAYGDKKGWVELTRTDPIALELARKYLESYRDYVKTRGECG